MEIDFIEIEHRENVLKLMEICGMDMKEAYELYVECGYNFEAAVNRNFNPVEAPRPYDPYAYDSYPQAQQEPPYIPPEENNNPQPFGGDSFFDEEDIEMVEYRKFKQSGKSFDKKYPIKTNKGFLDSIIPKFFRGTEENPFRRDLQKYLDMRVNIKTEHTYLSEAFHWCWKEKFPLAVLIMDFKETSLNISRKFFGDDHLVQKILSEQFKPFGLNSREYELQPELKPFFDMQKDNNSLIICRVNHLDNIEVVRRIHLGEAMEDIRKKIKQCKSQCIQNQLDESHICKQYIEELRGNFNYFRPKTIKENIKMREDKKLRRQQEEEYFKACQKKEVEQKPQQSRPQPPNYPETKIEQPQYKPEQPQYKPEPRQEVKPMAQVRSAEAIKQQRAQKLGRLRKYNSGIMFKIRVPGGGNLMVQIQGNERVQYLFDFVENQPEELGFNNELERKFDICMGFGGAEKLRGKENSFLRELFEGSEAVIVKEL